MSPSVPFVPRAISFALAPILVVIACGLPYYMLSWGERLRSPYHDWLKPSGFVGQSAGILAFALFSFLWLYPLRKRLGSRKWAGALPQWLNVHIIAGLLLPLVAGTHAGWRFTGLIGLGYLAMVIVCLSGIAGRYLYVRIPRRRSGLEMTRDDVIAERHELVERIAQSTGLARDRIRQILAPSAVPGDRRSLPSNVLGMLRDDLARHRSVHQLVREWKTADHTGMIPDSRLLKEVRRLARREMALSQQIRMLDATLDVFRFWHVAHRPFALTAFVAVAVHVVVVILLGATWFW
jgi:hypothetical protein